METPEAEALRLEAARDGKAPWRKWGPYLSERQWGTVREDYSENGTAWEYFPHDHARSRAYRRGEDGIAGFCDDKAQLCFAVTLWNERDPILKERLFGLTNSEGNHGEDVKEYYYYLDSTPTHSYMKYLYKYPQGAYPYSEIVETNRRRTGSDPEFELIDTGLFDGDRYFDVFVEYAKATPEDAAIRITVANRSEDEARLHVLPTLWFRNTWSWLPGTEPKPSIVPAIGARRELIARHHALGELRLTCDENVPFLFTENETNNERVFGTPNQAPFVKDGIDDAIVRGNAAAVNDAFGTKAAAHYVLTIPGKSERVIRLTLTAQNAIDGSSAADIDRLFRDRIAEADAFYAPLVKGMNADEALVMRQALAGMLWSKQYYNFDVAEWLGERGYRNIGDKGRRRSRNDEWSHMINDDVISMPDKWEYPWYAAWDLAFHTIPLAMVDSDFAKTQLDLMLRELYLHPSGQLPAYEWAFGDVNPPVHAFAVKLVYDIEKTATGNGDREFLVRAFEKLCFNFSWWVNRKDVDGNNVFEGGFLGLDNIGVFDRSAPLPTGGSLEQADGTAWMLFYALGMFEIACELAALEPRFADMALKFAEHTLWIALATRRSYGDRGSMWDEDDGFFYDVLRLPDGSATRLHVRSLVGLMPMAAVMVVDQKLLEHVPSAVERFRERIRRRPEFAEYLPNFGKRGASGSAIFALPDRNMLSRILRRLLDESEFLSPHGIRSLSRYHLEHPYTFETSGAEYVVQYRPAESDSRIFGGNSNWRGPIWMPMNVIIVRALFQYYRFFGDDFKIECPTGSGREMTLFEIGGELVDRLARIFLRDENGKRPVFGGAGTFQDDPYWRDNLLFYEYFHGDNGAGIGASHQTGWTGLIAYLMRTKRDLDSEQWLACGREAGTKSQRFPSTF